MVNIRIYRDTAGEIHRFAAKGHTGFAPHGEDIVCAAVSVLLQTAILGLEELAKAELSVEMSDGSLECRILAGKGNGIVTSTILNTMLLGLQAIETDYGDFIEVSEIGV
ncbi:MAG: ribosomal-processing cysteine protease Prp [Firmicutes bacterium]|nr:ribosomal-processing cysteine protease Prp [Bacillota bacterium]